MLTRKLGAEGLEVSTIGLGCMGMSDFYGPSDKQDNLKVLAAALEQGVTFWDSADMYGPKTNEQLLGEFFSSHPGSRDKVQLATKFGILRNDQGDFLGVSGKPEYVKQACDASLQRLGVDHIDLYYQHRVDSTVPIEDTVGALSDLVAAGKIRYIGLSEASANTIHRAHRVHPVSAVQSEYSLWSRDIEKEVLPVCKELNIGFVPYSPLGRGFLTGAIKTRQDLSQQDWRLSNPRFSEQNFQLNMELVNQLQQLAEKRGVTSAQLALAWLLSQYDQLVPIPGTRKVSRLQENQGAANIKLTQEELSLIAQQLDKLDVFGDRYPEEAKSLLQADSPAA